MTKRDLFFYFILKLKEKYDIINPEMELNRYHILNMLFIITVRYDRLLEDLGEGLNFNNFYAMKNGPIESDCYDFIYNLGGEFENILKDKNKIEKEIENKIDEKIKNIIEESTFKICSYLYDKDEKYLKEYISTFECWGNAWLKALHYGKKAFYIEPNDIKKDRQYYIMK